MKCILLQKTKPDHAGDFQNQFLVIGQHIASDQFDNLQKAALLVQESHQAVTVVYKLWRDMILIPGSQIPEIFAVAGQPVDSRKMSCIGQALIQTPETADKPFGILCDRLGEITALWGDRTDDGYRPVGSI